MRHETGVLWRQVPRVVPFQILREEQRKYCYLDQGFRSWAVPLPKTHEHTRTVLVIVRCGAAELPLPRPEVPGLSQSYHERQEAPWLPLFWRVVPLQRNRSKASSLAGLCGPVSHLPPTFLGSESIALYGDLHLLMAGDK